MNFKLDHLVIAAATLAEGRDWAEELLRVPAVGGGHHVSMGTHNALWSLGESYLEVIAVDPDGTRPDRPRWFGFNDEEVQTRLAMGPYLLTWVASANDMAAVRAPVPCHPPEDFARDDLRWQMLIPKGAALPLGGAWPLIIHWTHGLHPAQRMPDQGLALGRLEVAGAGVAATQAALGPVDGPVVLTPGDEPLRLSATITTPGGVVTF